MQTFMVILAIVAALAVMLHYHGGVLICLWQRYRRGWADVDHQSVMEKFKRARDEQMPFTMTLWEERALRDNTKKGFDHDPFE